MKLHKFAREAERIAERYRVNKGKKFRLKDWDAADVGKIDSKEDAEKLLEHGTQLLNTLQQKLWAQDKWALMIILQGMDAAGKDGVVSHVMGGVNPQGCDVWSFKQPSREELDHDYLWRAHQRVPSRGKIGIFNRSYYEEVLVVRVHPAILKSQRTPPALVTKNIWEERFEDIRHFEQHMARNGTVIRKFFLNVSKKEQKVRFLKRLEEPEKNWKFSAADIHERAYWDDYQKAYEDMIANTATEHAPWYVVPADHKWFARVVIGSVIVSALDRLDLKFPKVDAASLEEFMQVRRALENEDRKPAVAKVAKKAG